MWPRHRDQLRRQVSAFFVLLFAFYTRFDWKDVLTLQPYRYAFSRTSDSPCPICHAPIADEPDKESYSGSMNALMALLAVFHGRLVTTEMRELLLKEMQGKLDGRNMILLAAYLESLDGSLDARNAALGTLHSATPQSQSSLEQYLPIAMILPLPGIFVGVLMVCGYSDEIRMINLVFYVLLFFYQMGMCVKKEGDRAVFIALGLAVVFCLFACKCPWRWWCWGLRGGGWRAFWMGGGDGVSSRWTKRQ